MDEAWEEWEIYGDDDDDFEDDPMDDFDTVGWDPNLGAVRATPTGSRRGRRRRARPGGRRRRPRPRPPDYRRGPQAAPPGTRFLLPPGSAAPPGAALVPQVPAGAIIQISEPRVREIVNEVLEKRLPSWFTRSRQVPGSSGQDQLMSPLGLGAGILTNTVSFLALSAAPQRPFRGERLIIALARTVGAGVVPVRVSEFKIGENSQLVGAGDLPAEAFDPQAFGVRLAMSASEPGIVIQLRLETDQGAIPAGESISVTAAIIGRAVWGEAGGPG